MSRGQEKKRFPGTRWAPTRILLWFVVLTFIVGLAATNTGNNALYMVWALMLGLLVISALFSVPNLWRLHVEVEPPPEIYAGRPFSVAFTVRNQISWLPRYFLTISLASKGSPRLIPYLPGGGFSRGKMESMLPRRGLQRIGGARISSIFPLGFVRKGKRYPTATEVLVFPEVHPVAMEREESGRTAGDEDTRRRGRGHDLHSLRAFRTGDDPRRIHWKQTARTETVIFMEREAEENRRISVVFDNAVGSLESEAEERRFERLVSEAASVAVHYLKRGYQVELVTREHTMPYSSGMRQHRAILEALALIQSVPRSKSLLRGSGDGAELRLVMEREAAA